METTNTSNRLFFIDAIRAWAILMMLQGHFIDGLLDPVFRDPGNLAYRVWLYFRGITAPVFFTVSGFIFTYLLVRTPQTGVENPRVAKGLRRGLQLIIIGYLLRLNIFGLFQGQLYGGFFLVDVLHCIGLSILGIIGIYLLTIKRHRLVFPVALVGITLILFLFEPLYKQAPLSFLPTGIANYFTKANGSVFTIFPWLGYASLGAGLALLFRQYATLRLFYPIAISASFLMGYLLIFQSSPLFLFLSDVTGIALFHKVQENNYLFIRLGDVFVVFALFMLARRWLVNKTILAIGSSTLAIYVVHFIILYGSFTGLGLYRFFHHGLTPLAAIVGAAGFMLGCTFISLQYANNEVVLKSQLALVKHYLVTQTGRLYVLLVPVFKEVQFRAKLFLARFFGVKRG